MPIVYVIQSEPNRLGELKRIHAPISKKMLTKQPREIENHNLCSRKDFQIILLIVEYTFIIFSNFLSGVFNQYQNFWKK